MCLSKESKPTCSYFFKIIVKLPNLTLKNQQKLLHAKNYYLLCNSVLKIIETKNDLALAHTLPSLAHLAIFEKLQLLPKCFCLPKVVTKSVALFHIFEQLTI